MEQRHLGRTGLRVSRIGLGTLTWGRDTDEHDAADLLKTFWEAGGTLVDTADVYGDGESEYLLGKLMDGLVPRRDLVISTKAGSVPDPDRRFDGSRGHLLSALDASLARLGTDYVDVWHIHAYDPATPLDETLAALDTAVGSGRVRYAGVSNFCGWQLAKAATWQLAAPGVRTRLASTQMEYSLRQRGVEREVLPAALDLGIGLLPSSPLGRFAPACDRPAILRFGLLSSNCSAEEPCTWLIGASCEHRYGSRRERPRRLLLSAKALV